MSFYERWYNIMLSMSDWFIRRQFHIPGENALVKKYFAHLEPLPSIDDLMHSVSVVLVNTHRALSPARATMPGNCTMFIQISLSTIVSKYTFVSSRIIQEL